MSPPRLPSTGSLGRSPRQLSQSPRQQQHALQLQESGGAPTHASDTEGAAGGAGASGGRGGGSKEDLQMSLETGPHPFTVPHPLFPHNNNSSVPTHARTTPSCLPHLAPSPGACEKVLEKVLDSLDELLATGPLQPLPPDGPSHMDAHTHSSGHTHTQYPQYSPRGRMRGIGKANKVRSDAVDVDVDVDVDVATPPGYWLPPTTPSHPLLPLFDSSHRSSLSLFPPGSLSPGVGTLQSVLRSAASTVHPPSTLLRRPPRQPAWGRRGRRGRVGRREAAGAADAACALDGDGDGAGGGDGGGGQGRGEIR
jgi:hypothetical protein